ncbi:Pyridoxamine 5'-phosphate oxidase family protein [Raphanus sativus]|nr:Pyridoxamine 5'-phosphate oxidase family protein [Raphanus sativus]
MEALSTSAHISSVPEIKPLFKSSSQSSCWLHSSPAKRIPKLRTRDGSTHGLRIQALLHNDHDPDTKKSLECNRCGDITCSSSGCWWNRAGLFRTPISGGVQNATSAHALPRPALAVRNLLEQARFAHLCTMMSKMHHRREGSNILTFTLAIHTRNLLAEPRCSLVVQMPGWSCLSNARVTLFGDVYPLSDDEQEWAHKQYIAKHQHGTSEQWGNFHYFRMHNISDIYFIGGFGNGRMGLMSKSMRPYSQTKSLLMVQGIDVRVRQGAQFNIQRLAFEEGHGVETLEEAKAALWKVIEKVKLNYLPK